jgi:hypothetical protein
VPLLESAKSRPNIFHSSAAPWLTSPTALNYRLNADDSKNDVNILTIFR